MNNFRILSRAEMKKVAGGSDVCDGIICPEGYCCDPVIAYCTPCEEACRYGQTCKPSGYTESGVCQPNDNGKCKCKRTVGGGTVIYDVEDPYCRN